MTEDQLVLDQAWAWLRDVCGWFDRRSAAAGLTCVDGHAGERAAQLWQWNNFPNLAFEAGEGLERGPQAR
jgi:hypothetical protein